MRVHCRSGFLGISRFNTKSDSPMLVQKILQEACVPPDHLPPGLSEHLGMRHSMDVVMKNRIRLWDASAMVK